SFLTPKVTVFDGQGRVVASSASSDPLCGDLTLQLSRVTPLATYYVQVEGATSDVFSVGSYQLRIDSIPLVNGLLGGLLNTTGTVVTGLLNVDLHTNDSFLTSSNLLANLGASLTQADS